MEITILLHAYVSFFIQIRIQSSEYIIFFFNF